MLSPETSAGSQTGMFFVLTPWLSIPPGDQNTWQRDGPAAAWSSDSDAMYIFGGEIWKSNVLTASTAPGRSPAEDGMYVFGGVFGQDQV